MQQVLEKLAIHCYLFEVDYYTFNVLPGHSCGSCNFAMDENVEPVFDDLPKSESSLPISVKESLNLGSEDGQVSGDCFLPFSVLVSY